MCKERGIGFVFDRDLEVSKRDRLKGKVDKFNLKHNEVGVAIRILRWKWL